MKVKFQNDPTVGFMIRKSRLVLQKQSSTKESAWASTYMNCSALVNAFKLAAWVSGSFDLPFTAFCNCFVSSTVGNTDRNSKAISGLATRETGMEKKRVRVHVQVSTQTVKQCCTNSPFNNNRQQQATTTDNNKQQQKPYRNRAVSIELNANPTSSYDLNLRNFCKHISTF